MFEARVAVVILNWNGVGFLQKFLPNVVEHSAEDAEVIVADNGSTDDSVSWLKANFPEVTLLVNTKNDGYAGGYNWALSQVDAEYYMLLNSDIEVTPNWIPPLLHMMEEDLSIAACQPKILKYGEPALFEYAGAAGGFIDRYGYPFCRGRIFQDIEHDNGQYNDVTEIFWATGAALFVRAKLFHDLGGLDADFFAHMEEIDLCWRMKNLGYRIMYNGFSTVYHVGGGTLSSKNPTKTYLNIRNNLLMLYKNVPRHRFPILLLIRLILDGVASLKFLVDGGFGDFYAVIRAHFAFYKRVPKFSKKRVRTNPSGLRLIFNGSIVYRHYLKGVKHFNELDVRKFQ